MARTVVSLRVEYIWEYRCFAVQAVYSNGMTRNLARANTEVGALAAMDGHGRRLGLTASADRQTYSR